VLHQVLDKLLPGCIMKNMYSSIVIYLADLCDKGFDVFAVTQAWTLQKKYQIKEKD